MKNIEKAKTLEKLYKFLKKNNLEITACGCCGGYHIEQNGNDLCEGEDITYLENAIKYYRKWDGKIFVHDYSKTHEIEFVRMPDGKLYNLGGQKAPFHKFFKHYDFNDLMRR